MRNKTFSVLYVSLLMLLMGCEEFPLEGEHFEELSEEPKTELTLKLFDMPDTLLLLQDTYINYSFDITTTTDFAVYLVFEEKAYYLSSSNTGNFLLPKDFLDKGYINFEFAVLTTTSTGSLADYYKKELMIWSLKRVLRFDNSPTAKLDFTVVEDRNGSVYLEWPKYPHPNLLQLGIRRRWIPTPGALPVESFVWPERNATSFVDTTFIGGEIHYSLTTTNNYNSTLVSDEVSASGEPAKILGFKTINKDTLEITWSKPKYYGGASKYEIKIRDIFHQYFTPNATQTAARITGVNFGATSKISLTTVSRGGSAKSLTTSTQVYLGEIVPDIQKIIDDPIRNKTYLLNAPLLVKLENGIMDTISLAFDNTSATLLSSDGATLYLSSANTIYAINTLSFTVTDTYPLTINKNKYQFLERGNRFYIIYQYEGATSRIMVYDKLSKTILQDFTPSTSMNTSRIAISDDTQYLLESGTGVRLNAINANGTLTEINNLTMAGDSYAKFYGNSQFSITNKSTSSENWYKSYYDLPGMSQLTQPFLLIASADPISLDIENNQAGAFNYKFYAWWILTLFNWDNGAINGYLYTAPSPNPLNIKLYGRYAYHNNYLLKME